MKIVLSIIALVIVAFTAFSQINRGTIIVGASSNASLLGVKSGPSSTETYFNISPRVGYFFSNNWVLGTDVSYSKTGSYDATTLGLFSRYYIVGKYFLGAEYSTSKFSGASNSTNFLNLEGGYAAFLTESIAIEPSIIYATTTGDTPTYSNFGLRIGFSLYFNRK